METEVRTRILEGTYAAIAERGIAGTSLGDAALASGVSRATLYRYFPGGRDELIGAVIVFETLRFFQRLAEAVEGAPDLDQLLVDAIVFAHRQVAGHAVLQKVLETEPELVVPRLTLESANLVGLIARFLEGRFEASELPAGVEPGEAADYVARMVLSFIASPGRWDLADPDQVRTLVESELLAGVRPASDDHR